MMSIEDDTPQSVEEAGALLGAAITRYGSRDAHKTINPPRGTHSSFSIISPVPSSELFVRLHSLRAHLRSTPKDTPLVAAPSLLAGVLMKLLGVSNTLASAKSADLTKRTATPPMLSNPLRKLWVDCVVLCHSLGDGLSGNARINIFGFVRNMIQLASMNPKTSRAAGGTRVAALEVIGALMEDERLSKTLASWSLDVIVLSQRALRSSGNGEPTYRIAAVRTACSAAIASRLAFMNVRPMEGSARLVLKGALEDKAIFEMVKLLRIAVTDKFPEVRSAAATLSSLLAPLVIHTQVRSVTSSDAAAASSTASLEDIMTMAIKNLDDESPDVAARWAEALARCMCTCIEFGQQVTAEKSSQRDVEGRSDATSAPGNEGPHRSGRKGVLSASSCSSLPKALKQLVVMYVKAGGEFVAPRSGGVFSTGGRAVRVGFCRTIVELLRIQSSLHAIGEGKSLSHKETILIVLSMIGKDMDAQLEANDRSTASTPEFLDATTVITPSMVLASAGGTSNKVFGQGFGQSPRVSPADGAIARLAVIRILRDGVSNLAPETIQIKILHELISLCTNKEVAVNVNQMQVVLGEISHLFVTLGEVTASAIDDLIPSLADCLRHPDHGVRHEAVMACAAMSSVFPSHGRQIAQDCINAIQLEHAELMAIASTNQVEQSSGSSPASRFRFRRAAPVKDSKVDESLKHQYAIHGMSLMVSVVIRDLPKLPGGLPQELFDTVMSVAEILSASLFSDVMTTGNPSGAVTSVRAGFGLICGALAAGPLHTTKYITRILGLWQKTCNPSRRGKQFTANHELMCIDSLLTSIVVFLQNCSELLLSVPDTLSKITLILEQLLPMFFSDGKLGTIPTNPLAAARMDSAKSSLMEAFAWLPSGSFPMVSDSVFTFAASHIQFSIQVDVTCSILPSLVSKEDMILDTVSFTRANGPSQVGGARDLDNDIIARTSAVAHHGDRESVLHLYGSKSTLSPSNIKLFDSEVLGMIASDESAEKAPTVLHEVGNWRLPVSPSCSSKIRLVDAAIQAFAATFGLKGGKEQQRAMEMLESLVPPAFFLNDQERRTKAKDVNSSIVNVTAVLLSCLKALPVSESTHNVPIGLGPAWMNKAKGVLVSILPAPSHTVRRAAAEGLAFLATFGVKEDAHFLQSSVIHSLDELMKGSHSHGQPRVVSAETVSAARAGALLTMASMQRAVNRMKRQRDARARLRGASFEEKDATDEDLLPFFQMMTRVLPSVAYRPLGGFFSARTYGLHAFGLLFANSSKLLNRSLNEQDHHLLKKAVELVEDNFTAAWTVASFAFDHGDEADKLSSESSFLAVLLRLMSFILPSAHHLKASDPGIAMRFSKMAVLIMESCYSHPVVQMEAMAFYEVLAEHQELLPAHAGGLKYDEHPILCSIPFLMASVRPRRSLVHHSGPWSQPQGSLSSKMCLRVALRVIKILSASEILVAEWSDMRIVSLLFAALEDVAGTRTFPGETFHRGLAAPREAELVYTGADSVEEEISDVVQLLLFLERNVSRNSTSILFRYILLARSFLVGSKTRGGDDGENDEPYTVERVVQAALDRASTDAAPVVEYSNPVRWQVKTLSVQIATIALNEMLQKCRQDDSNPKCSSIFNPKLANAECLKECKNANKNGSPMPDSKLALHVGAVVTAACVTATATVDQVELRILQENAMHMIVEIMDCFGLIPDPEQTGTKLLHDYIPQISSCIKNALAAPNEEESEVSSRLFMVGCETLRGFVRNDVSNEKSVLKRIIRPALPSASECPFFEYETGVPPKLLEVEESKLHINMRASLLPRIGKFWALGTIPLEDTETMEMINVEKGALGVHSAALAIDGARLLLGEKLSLCGTIRERIDFEFEPAESGFFYKHITDIDNSVKSALAKTWASCACTAVVFLSAEIDSSSHRRQSCETWLRKIVPFLFVGLGDALSAKTDNSFKAKSLEWSRGIDQNEIAASCLKGITALVATPGLLELESKWKSEIESSLERVYESILLPKLSNPLKPVTSNEDEDAILVTGSCAFLQSLSKNSSLTFNEDSSLLLSLLRPLNLLQGGSVDLKDTQAASIVSACMVSVAGIVSKPRTPSSLVKAMVSLILAVSSNEGKSIPENVKSASRFLLKECLSHEGISSKEHSAIATAMAKAGDWDAWSVVVCVDEGLTAKNSLTVVQASLSDVNVPETQLSAVSALRVLLQSATTPSPFVGRVVSTVGPEILAVFQAYGTLAITPAARSNRTTVCAECMKLVLLSFQQFTADSEENETGAFLVVLFQTFIAVLRFNGLPNHPPPQTGSDPAIGRMCAQAITHIARTTPLPFKTCMSSLSEHDRAMLEFAVRAEMSGYATAPQAPVKKKLNLKGFKK